MRGTVVVETEVAYQNWLKEQSQRTFARLTAPAR
jgi:heme/copper-type cytochrome/quinol oxidase subunit 2